MANNGGHGAGQNPYGNYQWPQNTAGTYVNGVWVPGAQARYSGSSAGASGRPPSVFSQQSGVSSATNVSTHQQQQQQPAAAANNPHPNLAGFVFNPGQNQQGPAGFGPGQAGNPHGQGAGRGAAPPAAGWGRGAPPQQHQQQQQPPAQRGGYGYGQAPRGGGRGGRGG